MRATGSQQDLSAIASWQDQDLGLPRRGTQPGPGPHTCLPDMPGHGWTIRLAEQDDAGSLRLSDRAVTAIETAKAIPFAERTQEQQRFTRLVVLAEISDIGEILP